MARLQVNLTFVVLLLTACCRAVDEQFQLLAEVLSYCIALGRLRLGFVYHVSIAVGVSACRLDRNVS